jgi:hypothetical protein
MPPARIAPLALAIALLWPTQAARAQAPPALVAESVYPRHAVRARSTVINVAIISPDPVSSAAVIPAEGVTVSRIHGDTSATVQNVGWWEVQLDVAADAAPGERTLVLTTSRGQTSRAPIVVATHAPVLTGVTATPPRSGRPAGELRVTVSDDASDLGTSPYVWFAAACGGEPIVGALRTRVVNGVATTALHNVRKAARDGLAPRGPCDIEVRITDAAGVESNRLHTMVEFTE